jgi:hypothetical protein
VPTHKGWRRTSFSSVGLRAVVHTDGWPTIKTIEVKERVVIFRMACWSQFYSCFVELLRFKDGKEVPSECSLS